MSKSRYVAGLDPGGAGQFGWAVGRMDGQVLTILGTGHAEHAGDAMHEVTRELGDHALAALGIDAPLYWTPDGGREADARVRAAIGAAGCPHPAGTVQHFNSLRGACVVQGAMAANLARTSSPSLRVTEAHPKALLWLLRDPTGQRLGALGIRGMGDASEHERDAALGAYAAAAMLRSTDAWIDLAAAERASRTTFSAISDTVEYWMPKLP